MNTSCAIAKAPFFLQLQSEQATQAVSLVEFLQNAFGGLAKLLPVAFATIYKLDEFHVRRQLARVEINRNQDAAFRIPVSKECDIKLLLNCSRNSGRARKDVVSVAQSLLGKTVGRLGEQIKRLKSFVEGE